MMESSLTSVSALRSSTDIAPSVIGTAAARRIALCHLDSLRCLPALNALFTQCGDRIGLVVASRRFGSRHGGFWSQLCRSVGRSGFRFTFWLGFDLIAPGVAQRLSRVVRLFTGCPPTLCTLRELAASRGAKLVAAADVNSDNITSALAAYQPDIVVVFHFDQILHRGVIAAAPAGILNIHPSLLPAFRGPCPSFWVLAHGEVRSGVTVHRIEDESIDAGPPVACAALDLQRPLSVSELDSSLFTRGVQLFIEGSTFGWVASSSTGPDRKSYFSFPDRAAVRAARRRGVRLWRFSHVMRLLAAAIGIWQWRNTKL